MDFYRLIERVFPQLVDNPDWKKFLQVLITYCNKGLSDRLLVDSEGYPWSFHSPWLSTLSDKVFDIYSLWSLYAANYFQGNKITDIRLVHDLIVSSNYNYIVKPIREVSYTESTITIYLPIESGPIVNATTPFNGVDMQFSFKDIVVNLFIGNQSYEDITGDAFTPVDIISFDKSLATLYAPDTVSDLVSFLSANVSSIVSCEIQRTLGGYNASEPIISLEMSDEAVTDITKWWERSVPVNVLSENISYGFGIRDTAIKVDYKGGIVFIETYGNDSFEITSLTKDGTEVLSDVNDNYIPRSQRSGVAPYSVPIAIPRNETLSGYTYVATVESEHNGIQLVTITQSTYQGFIPIYQPYDAETLTIKVKYSDEYITAILMPYDEKVSWYLTSTGAMFDSQTVDGINNVIAYGRGNTTIKIPIHPVSYLVTENYSETKTAIINLLSKLDSGTSAVHSTLFEQTVPEPIFNIMSEVRIGRQVSVFGRASKSVIPELSYLRVTTHPNIRWAVFMIKNYAYYSREYSRSEAPDSWKSELDFYTIIGTTRHLLLGYLIDTANLINEYPVNTVNQLVSDVVPETVVSWELQESDVYDGENLRRFINYAVDKQFSFNNGEGVRAVEFYVSNTDPLDELIQAYNNWTPSVIGQVNPYLVQILVKNLTRWYDISQSTPVLKVFLFTNNQPQWLTVLQYYQSMWFGDTPSAVQRANYATQAAAAARTHVTSSENGMRTSFFMDEAPGEWNYGDLMSDSANRIYRALSDSNVGLEPVEKFVAEGVTSPLQIEQDVATGKYHLKLESTPFVGSNTLLVDRNYMDIHGISTELDFPTLIGFVYAIDGSTDPSWKFTESQSWTKTHPITVKTI